MHIKNRKKFSILRSYWPAKDWLVSHAMLDYAVKTILSKIKLDRTYDIPYLAGYSNDGKTIYIDRHMPKSFVTKAGKRIFTDRFLILHEAIEKTLIDKLGLHYQFAHQIALRSEQAAVRADKIPWREYDAFMQAHIKGINDEKLTRVPKKLDTKPYRDENDTALLKHMKAATRNKKK
jgi:hypothetical protein